MITSAISSPTSIPPRKRKAPEESATSPPSKLIFFAGAPSVDSLRTRPLQVAEDLAANGYQPSCSPSRPNWRALSVVPRRLKSGFTQNLYPDSPAPSDAEESEALETQFAAEDSANLETQCLGEASTELATQFTDEASTTLNTTLQSQRPPLPPLTALTDLEDLPPPTALTAHPPISALVSIQSIEPVRTIETKYSKMQLVKLTVGDPTMQHLDIDVWLQPSPVNIEDRELKAIVRDLRPMDVVVLRGVKLREFGGIVKGVMGQKSEVCVVERLRTFGREERKGWRRRWEGGLAGKKVLEHVEWTRTFMDVGGTSFLDQSAYWPEPEE